MEAILIINIEETVSGFFMKLYLRPNQIRTLNNSLLTMHTLEDSLKSSITPYSLLSTSSLDQVSWYLNPSYPLLIFLSS